MTDNGAAALRRFAEWAGALTVSEVPERVLRRAALVVMDNLGAAVAARDEPQVRRLLAGMPSGEAAEATVFLGGADRRSRRSAVLANGVAANWCQLDEGYRRASCHAGLYAVPAVVAEAEATHQTVAETLRAVVVSYELVARLAEAWRFRAAVVHPHAAWSAIGAAAGIATLRRLSPPQFLAAVNAAASLALPGPFGHAVRGALIVNAWAALGAVNGMQGVDLAACGLAAEDTTVADVFEGVFGAAYGVQGHDPGAEWLIESGYHKVHSCCQHAMSTVEALLHLVRHDATAIESADIDGIAIEIHRAGLILDSRDPPTTLSARFSIPHIAATVCVHGQADVIAFSETALHLPEVARLRAGVELTPIEPDMPWPHDRAARVTLRMRDGTRRRAECLSPEGGPDRPFGIPTIVRKIRRMTEAAYPAFASTAQKVLGLESGMQDMPWRQVVCDLTSLHGRP